MTVTVGIDGGGSKTEIAVIDADDQILALKRGGPANDQYIPAQQFCGTLGETLQEVLTESGVDPMEIGRAGFCMTARFGTVEETFHRLLPRTDVVPLMESDVVLAQCGWLQRYGAVALAGTGSCFSAHRDGQWKHFGGLGSLLGDEGSGFDLAIRGIKAALRALPYDGRGADTVPTERVLSHFGIEKRWEVVKLTTQSPLDRTRLATFAREVVRSADEGDEVSIRICLEIAESLASDVIFAAAKLFHPDEAVPVGLGGGILQGSSLISGAVREGILHAFPVADVRVASIPPAVAAAHLAARGGRMTRQETGL